MDRLQKEKLKDIIIDYLFDYCFNDRVRIVEGDGNKLTISPNFNIDDDPVTKSLFESIKKSQNLKMYYGKRDKDSCELVSEDGKTAHADFLQRVQRLGIEKSDDLGQNVKEAVQFLCDRSYLVRDQPLNNKVGLTSKGIKHYESGKSFEEDYLKTELLLKSDRRSRHSKIIAIISLVLSGLIGVLGLLFKYSEPNGQPASRGLPIETLNSLTLDYIEEQIKIHGNNNLAAYFRPKLKSIQLNRLRESADRDTLRFNKLELELIRHLVDNSLNGKERRLLNLQSSNVFERTEISFSKFVQDEMGQNGVVHITQLLKNDSSKSVHKGFEQLNFYVKGDSAWTLRKQMIFAEY